MSHLAYAIKVLSAPHGAAEQGCDHCWLDSNGDVATFNDAASRINRIKHATQVRRQIPITLPGTTGPHCWRRALQLKQVEPSRPQPRGHTCAMRRSPRDAVANSASGYPGRDSRRDSALTAPDMMYFQRPVLY